MKVCSRQRCTRPSRCLGLCASHATAEADRLFSLYIRDRDGWCIACGSAENLQCAHIISRRYRATRWDQQNALTLCQSQHVYFTHRPLEWEAFAETKGFVAYAELRYRALFWPKPILAQVIAELREKVSAA